MAVRVKDDRSAGVDVCGEEETGRGRGSAFSGGASWARGGRIAALLTPLALTVLTAAWLFLGATRAREITIWLGVALLAVSVLAVAATALRAGGRSRSQSYARAVAAVPSDRGGAERRVPGRLAGTRGSTARTAALLVTVPTLLALWAALGAAEPHRSARTAALADADAAVTALPIARIENESSAGSSSRARATADYTVMLPAAERGGAPVPATFTADTLRKQEIGSELYVAHAPGRPDLGALGDDQKAEVERQLAGRTVESGTAWLIGGLWILVTLALLVGWWLQDGNRRRPRTVDQTWSALRVTVSGLGTHTDAPPVEGTGPAAEKKRRENTRRFSCLLLDAEGAASSTTAQPLPFRARLSHEAAAPALAGSRGWLLWHPDHRRGRDLQACLVADNGWQLPGTLPLQAAGHLAATRPHPDPARTARLLDPGAHWPSTAPRSLLVGLLVALAAMTALLLLPDNGLWRVWTALIGALAPALALAARALRSR